MIKIYTDGSCLENPGNGGWAAIINNDGSFKKISGGEKNTTNNRMELLAPINALKQIDSNKQIEIYTDFLTKYQLRYYFQARIRTQIPLITFLYYIHLY